MMEFGPQEVAGMRAKLRDDLCGMDVVPGPLIALRFSVRRQMFRIKKQRRLRCKPGPQVCSLCAGLSAFFTSFLVGRAARLCFETQYVERPIAS